MNTIEFDAVSDDGTVAIEWVELGEGLSGDYDPSDDEDTELLRFDAYEVSDEQEWLEMEDGSYCTLVPAATSEEDRKKLAAILANTLAASSEGGTRRKTAERLSWISPQWLHETSDVVIDAGLLDDPRSPAMKEQP